MQDPQAGPTGKERGIRAPGTVLSHRVEACGAPMTAALVQQPVNAELDPVARTYQERFATLNERIGRRCATTAARIIYATTARACAHCTHR